MVSVCIASYNGGKYIRRQLESILVQLGPGDEIVISDDGSTDDTASAIASLHDERIRFLPHKPSGITANFENAVRHSRGDIIFFADQDDEWLPNKVSVVLEAFDRSGRAVVQHDASVVDGQGEEIFPSWAEQRGLHKGIFRNLIKTCYIGCCMAFKRELLKKAFPFRGHRYGILHDEWVGFIAEHNGGICYIPDKLIKYCRHEGTVSQINRPGPLWRQIFKRVNAVWNLLCYRKDVLLGRTGLSEEPDVVKVAIMAGEKFNGGVWGILYNYFQHIDRSRFKITFFVGEPCPPPLGDEIRRLGGDFVTIPPRYKTAQYLFTLIRIFRRERFDIVHANLTTLNFMPLFSAWVARVPVRISHSHSNSNPADKGLNVLKNGLRILSHLFVTDYFTCSEKSGRWLFGNAFFNTGRVQLIHNAIDCRRFAFDDDKRQSIRAQYGLGGKFVIGNIGRFTVAKNHPFILKVFAEIVRLNPNARLLYVGWGELEQEVRQMVRDMGLEPYVVFAGTLSDTSAYYSAMDVFLLPSIFEGLCVCLIEAQANGLPCVVSTNNSIESKLAPWLTFKSLEDSPSSWAAVCISAVRNLEPSKAVRYLEQAGYEVRLAVRDLESAYLKTIGKAR